jgi:2',3'-cyclic-nucleotide 2'-phosphodiesterase (5'-nucleotidase family)
MNEALIINNTPIVQAGDRGKYIGKGILDYNENTKQITLKSWESIELMKPEAEFNYEKDPVVVDIINKFAVEIENEIELIANIPESFTSSHLRLELTPLGKLVNDAVLKEVIDKKPHLSIINSGAIRASLIKGIVKNTDVYTMFPFEDKVICIDLTGEEILDIINASYSENRGSGAFLQYSSNIQIIINDDEIKEVFITTPLIPDNESGKMPIVKEKTYTIATLDYLYDEGDGYHQFKNGKNLIRTDIDMDEAIINYLKEKYPIK